MAADKKINPLLKTLLEIGPVGLFVLAYNKPAWFGSLASLSPMLNKPIFLATGVFMAAMVIALAASWMLTRTIPVMPLVTLAVVLVFGGLTLYLQDDTFIKVKPTIVNTLFGTILVGGVVFGRSFLKIVFGPAFQLDDLGWRKLSLRWGLFFLFLAIVNEIVWRNFSESFWVGFKFWGMTGLSFLFVLTQVPLMTKHALPDEEEETAAGE